MTPCLAGPSHRPLSMPKADLAAPLPDVRRLLLVGPLELLEARAPVLSDSECDELLQAIAAAPEDVDHRHTPLESLADGSFLSIAQRLVERLRATDDHFSELVLQRAFCISYSAGDGHAAHADPCAFTINVGLSRPDAYAGGELEIHGSAATRFSVGHRRGCALLHAGALRHSAAALTSGTRSNLILWCDRRPRCSVLMALSPTLRGRVLRGLELASLCRLAAASRGCAEDAGRAPQWRQLEQALAPPRRLLGEAWGCADCAALHAAPPPPAACGDGRATAWAGDGGRLLRALTALAAAVDAHKRPPTRRVAALEDAELAQARRDAARSRVAARVASAVRALERSDEAPPERTVVLVPDRFGHRC